LRDRGFGFGSAGRSNNLNATRSKRHNEIRKIGLGWFINYDLYAREQFHNFDLVRGLKDRCVLTSTSPLDEPALRGF
jgi:hypothetical protein